MVAVVDCHTGNVGSNTTVGQVYWPMASGSKIIL